MSDKLFWTCCAGYFLSLYGAIRISSWISIPLLVFFVLIPFTSGKSESPNLLKTQLNTLKEVRKN